MGKRGPKPAYTEEEVLDTLRDRSDPCEPVTAPELGEELGVSRHTTRARLESLAAEGTLASKKVGGRARVYWIPHAGERE